MTTAICSVYFDNVNPRVLMLHRKVVERFMPTTATYFQIRSNDHAMAMNRMTKQLAVVRSDHDFDRIIWLDIDCIPLNSEALVYPFAHADFWGCAQRANHINNDQHIYASPFAMGFKLSTYEKMGYPSFLATHRGDVGEELTYVYERQHGGAAPLLFDPLHVEAMPEGGYWNLCDGKTFGLGTSYGSTHPLFYHAFQIRTGENFKRFESKCREVLE
jgi:hypothetical protein